jgi:hypothetical protein
MCELTPPYRGFVLTETDETVTISCYSTPALAVAHAEAASDEDGQVVVWAAFEDRVGVCNIERQI